MRNWSIAAEYNAICWEQGTTEGTPVDGIRVDGEGKKGVHSTFEDCPTEKHSPLRNANWNRTNILRPSCESGNTTVCCLRSCHIFGCGWNSLCCAAGMMNSILRQPSSRTCIVPLGDVPNHMETCGAVSGAL